MDHISRPFLRQQTLLLPHPTNYFVDDLSPTHTSPPTSASTVTSWPPQRISNTREDFPQVKYESSMNDRLNGNLTRTPDDPMPSTSDFVKKLYKYVVSLPSLSAIPPTCSPRMLEDPTFQSVVCWGPQGDCFVVKAR